MDDKKFSQRAMSAQTAIQLNQDFVLQLKETLHSTLELEHLFKLFYTAIQADFPITGISFQNLDHKISLYLGDTTQDYIRQQLILNKSLLGTLRFFPETLDLKALTHYSDCLLYPIRNALQYRTAILRASQDQITGLGNRYALESAVQQLSKNSIPLTLMLIDVDDFKTLNDQQGHTAGDQALAHIAQHLIQLPVYKDSVFRYGGDEFLILLPDTGLEEARQLAINLQSKLNPTPTTVSIGLVQGNTQQEAFHTLFERADKALYKAKAQGKNCIVVH